MNISDEVENMMSRRCLMCGTVFSFHISRKDTAKYCSRSCKDASQKGQPAWNAGLTKEDYAIWIKKTPNLSNKCLNCGVPVENKYCSHGCQLLHRNPDEQRKNKTYTEIYGEEKAKEIQQKISAGVSKAANETHFTRIGASVLADQRRGKTFEEIYGVGKAKEMKDSIRNSLAVFRETPEGLKIRQEASDRGIYLALSGREFANTKKGYFEGVYFGSSLEESFLHQMLRIMGSLKNVERNTTKIIPIDNSFHKTVPDYLIKDNNGGVIAIVEVKGNHLLERPRVYKKALALYTYGREQSVFVGYFTYDILNIFKEFQGNLEPRRLNSLLNYMVLELHNYIVSRKVQRLSVEDRETNKTLKNVTLVGDIPNDPLPYIGR